MLWIFLPLSPDLPTIVVSDLPNVILYLDTVVSDLPNVVKMLIQAPLAQVTLTIFIFFKNFG